jgi:hypothetical protein
MVVAYFEAYYRMSLDIGRPRALLYESLATPFKLFTS